MSPTVTQVADNAGRTIGAIAGVVVLANRTQQSAVVLLAFAGRPVKPVIKAAGRHSKHTAHCSCGPGHTMAGDKAVLHLGAAVK
jgi:hypothetical protein